jgi:hypothetical protein
MGIKTNTENCWQYEIRVANRDEDLKRANLSEDDVKDLRVSDFTIQFEEKDACYDEVKEFIERHEWLGRMSLYPTHIFTARYNGILAGVVIMDMPSVFSKLVGEKTKKIERLISRGACISWSPKNLGSSLIMYAINWMVKNTRFRVFVAYSDVEANELGTLYQACNFYYIGKKSGASKQYRIESGRWVSDRYFRARSVYRKVAKNDGIIWQLDWQKGDSVKFDQMPEDIAKRIKKLSKDYMLSCESREIGKKHKYVYVLGENKYETKQLRREFLERNKLYSYPKKRGT